MRRVGSVCAKKTHQERVDEDRDQCQKVSQAQESCAAGRVASGPPISFSGRGAAMLSVQQPASPRAAGSLHCTKSARPRGL